MDDLLEYLELIVEPTFADYQSNPTSARHAFFACVAIYHAIDRMPKSAGNLRNKWKKQSLEFFIVDMVAHHFKHVRSNDEKRSISGPGLPLASLVFRKSGRKKRGLDDYMDFHNLYFVIRDAIKFVRQQAEQSSLAVPNQTQIRKQAAKRREQR
jgi:hypothetical protein